MPSRNAVPATAPEHGAQVKRLGLAYSDGSFTVFPAEWTMEQARSEALDADRHEDRRAHFTRVVRVAAEIIEEIETPSALKSLAKGKVCPACGQRHPEERADGR